ncbi:hypothetical protein PTKIN_Ptkin14bG0184800 [Pterospermum kingtungense]
MTSNIFLLFIFGILASQAMSRTLDDAAIAEHEQWMAKHGRTYQSQAEKEKRFKIFKENLEYIQNFNKTGNKTYKLSLNKYSDLTHDEFVAARTGYIRPDNVSTSTESTFSYAEFTDLPSSMDWREKGAVTPIKDQEDCGCCWAFSAVAATEGITKIKTGNIVSLSEQQVLDCSGNIHGCTGGSKIEAFKYIIQNHGLTSKDSYPYHAIQGTCNTEKVTSQGSDISRYESVPSNNEKELLKAVSNQPVSVSIEAARLDFRHYQSGIFTGNCGTIHNHAVTVVGFGTSEDGIDYWLVKNSWGEDWGEKGYIRMQRNVAAKEGLCGIATIPVYPIA